MSQQESSEILLATALVKVSAADGTQHVMRCLIDQGSQICLISERAAQQLCLKRQSSKGVVLGVGEKESSCKGMLQITCQSIYSDFKFNANAFIMKNLIKNLPNRSFEKPSWAHTSNINLADSTFYSSRPVDLLLSAEIYSIILMDGISRGQNSMQPIAQQTQLGWLLCGGNINTFQCNVTLSNIEDLHQFWKIEDIHEQNEMSAKDQQCVDYYNSTTKRLENGRYEVRLPIEPQALEKLGKSKQLAAAQFRSLERKFNRHERLAQQYKQFIREYEQLGHMKLTKPSQGNECFLPHHAVYREESSTTKLRVVFNASSRTTSGYSLNDLMGKGPNLQLDLQALIIKWRLFCYAYTADIEKMYRQILVNKEDQKLQQILWRDDPSQPLKSFSLSTVTYGMKSAPFLAIMTLHQLAKDEQHNYPNAARSLKEEFYMDDLVSGAHTLIEGCNKIGELRKLLSSAGFQLRKWSANNQKLLKNINENDQSSQSNFTFKSEESVKTLGLRWDSTKDEFSFEYNNVSSDNTKLTKRLLLSEISKIFDPLGWLAPLTTKMKLLFQEVWLEANLHWSDTVPDNIKKEWMKIKGEMKCISQYVVPRWLQTERNSVIELHGFCDASIKCTAAVIYGRVVKEKSASVVLIAAKTRLVPTKKEVTLPRLELCAAELLAKLMSKVVNSISSNSIESKIYGWSDSMVTLGWIQGNPERWKPFVANRVKKITSTMPPEQWHYVATKQNPADAASRGMTSSQLKENSQWWHGPNWLSKTEFKAKQEKEITTNVEIKKK